MNLIPVSVLKKWAWNLPVRQIHDGDTLYLERFYVGEWGKWTCFLHRFLSSDPDRGVHDHPWDESFSVLVNGDYTEELLPKFAQEEIDLMRPLRDRHLIGETAQRVHRLVRFFNRIPGGKFHRVLLNGGEVWSLFFHRTRCKAWGFLRDGQYHVFEDFDPKDLRVRGFDGWPCTTKEHWQAGYRTEQWGPA